jgi:hypothetical protein
MVIDTAGLADTTFSVSNLLTYKIYYWRVNATNAIGTGLWAPSRSFRTTSVVAVEQQPQVPDAFALSQNFPNPFNATTRIRFTVAAASQTTLRVYDLLGREVATLVDGQLEAGTYEVPFEAGDLPSGPYLYVFVSGGDRMVKKMLLLR